MKPTLVSINITVLIVNLEFTSNSSIYAFWLKNKKKEVISYLFWFLNQNQKLQFEMWICKQNIILCVAVPHISKQKKIRSHKITSRIVCTCTNEINKFCAKLKEWISLVRIIFCAFQIYIFCRVNAWET